MNDLFSGIERASNPIEWRQAMFRNNSIRPPRSARIPAGAGELSGCDFGLARDGGRRLSLTSKTNVPAEKLEKLVPLTWIE
jgi:hypothetical protein